MRPGWKIRPNSMLNGFKDSDAARRGKRMTQMIFHDPFVNKDPFPKESFMDSSSVPVPAGPAVPATVALPQGREREVQQIIHDLSVLAAEQDSPST